jgi:hypothetical protein
MLRCVLREWCPAVPLATISPRGSPRVTPVELMSEGCVPFLTETKWRSAPTTLRLLALLSLLERPLLEDHECPLSTEASSRLPPRLVQFGAEASRDGATYGPLRDLCAFRRPHPVHVHLLQRSTAEQHQDRTQSQGSRRAGIQGLRKAATVGDSDTSSGERRPASEPQHVEGAAMPAADRLPLRTHRLAKWPSRCVPRALSAGGAPKL